MKPLAVSFGISVGSEIEMVLLVELSRCLPTFRTVSRLPLSNLLLNHKSSSTIVVFLRVDLSWSLSILCVVFLIDSSRSSYLKYSLADIGRNPL